MHFDNFKDFIEMGGHGFYVWLSYGVSLSALIFYFVFSDRQSQSNIKTLKKFYSRIDSQISSDEKSENESSEA